VPNGIFNLGKLFDGELAQLFDSLYLRHGDDILSIESPSFRRGFGMTASNRDPRVLVV